MSVEKVQELFKQAEVQLITCRDALNNDDLIDMSPFEGIIKDLCDNIKELPRDEKQEFEMHLSALGDALNAISVVLNEKKAVIEAQIGGLNTQQKAHNAYAESAITEQDDS